MLLASGHQRHARSRCHYKLVYVCIYGNFTKAILFFTAEWIQTRGQLCLLRSGPVNKKPDTTTNKSISGCEHLFNITQPFPLLSLPPLPAVKSSLSTVCKQDWFILPSPSSGFFQNRDPMCVPERRLIPQFTIKRANVVSDRCFSTAAANTGRTGANTASIFEEQRWEELVRVVHRSDPKWVPDFFFFLFNNPLCLHPLLPRHMCAARPQGACWIWATVSGKEC